MNNNKLKLGLLAFLIFSTIAMPAMAIDLDMSVDEEIKKKYDTSKIQYDMPSLPKINSTANTNNPTYSPTTNTVPKTSPTYITTVPSVTAVDKSSAIKIPAWTTFKAKSNQQISDRTAKGTKISFTTTENVYKKYITIPAGTKLYGIITNSHTPQNTGNGGLVEIKITNMTYKGKTYTIDGKITKANSKKIFFNNIKGKRQYITGIGKQIDKGEAFYQKTRKTTSKMSNNPILVILSPIPTIVGMAGYSVCTILSPITAITTKGGHLTIPTGSSFEIKLLEPAYVY